MLFYRAPKNPEQYQNVRDKLRKVFRSDNLVLWNQHAIYESFQWEEADSFLCYAFEVLAEWRKRNEAYTDDYVKGMNFIIKMLNLNKYLYTEEINYVTQYQEIVFAQRRNLKDLIVDFPEQPGETIWYRYAFDTVEQNNQPLATNGVVYFSNQRVLIVQENFYTFFLIDAITDWRLKGQILTIFFGKTEIKIISPQILAIYVSFERVMRILKRFTGKINS